MSFKGGVEEAAKMLAGLNHKERQNILKLIEQKDPNMALKLKKNMVTLEDLQYLTVKMLQEFLRDIDLSDLGLALRISSPDLKKFILNNVSTSIQKDIEEILLGPLQAVSKVDEATEKIMDVLFKKISKGEIIINKKGETLV